MIMLEVLISAFSRLAFDWRCWLHRRAKTSLPRYLYGGARDVAVGFMDSLGQ